MSIFSFGGVEILKVLVVYPCILGLYLVMCCVFGIYSYAVVTQNEHDGMYGRVNAQFL